MPSRAERILIVGAGFAGAVVARTLAEAGYTIDMIDRRDHVAGNAFDEINDQGIRFHRYGPHLFHTSNMRVVDWLSRFTEWTPYDHRVTARLPDGRLAPLPVNRRTLELVFGRPIADEGEAKALLSDMAVKLDHEPRNGAEYLHANIGVELTDLFFRPYTRKMWGHDLTEIDAAVVKRIPIRFDDEDRYFPNDSFQALPTAGYTQLVRNILDHEAITVRLATPFDKSMLADADFAFLCSPIDEFFDYSLGHLPYRSIKFHHDAVPREDIASATATVNYTDTSPFTRSTFWHLLPNHDPAHAATVTKTTEEPCDYRDNDFERYYPVKTADGEYDRRYRAYQAMADGEAKLMFIGRCGTYQYLDMHQVINQTLTIAEKWLADRP